LFKLTSRIASKLCHPVMERYLTTPPRRLETHLDRVPPDVRRYVLLPYVVPPAPPFFPGPPHLIPNITCGVCGKRCKVKNCGFRECYMCVNAFMHAVCPRCLFISSINNGICANGPWGVFTVCCLWCKNNWEEALG